MMLPYAVAIWLFLAGLYGIATTRSVIHLVSCLLVAQSSTYVLLLAIGFRSSATAPILKGVPPGTPMVDPMVQALALTDIVVGATVSALILVFAVQAHKRTGSVSPEKMNKLKG
ncbi:MAG: sodium:proton antiporter [Desulfobacteraceae bacterium]|nr:sodium:proton antiporter [Desulfobacteraceae bacterium]